MVPIELFDLRAHLHPHGRLAGPLLAKHDRRAGIGRVAIHLVPTGVKRARTAAALKDGIGLRVFIRKRISGHPVVIEKLVDVHGVLVRFVACGRRSQTPEI